MEDLNSRKERRSGLRARTEWNSRCELIYRSPTAPPLAQSVPRAGSVPHAPFGKCSLKSSPRTTESQISKYAKNVKNTRTTVENYQILCKLKAKTAPHFLLVHVFDFLGGILFIGFPFCVFASLITLSLFYFVLVFFFFFLEKIYSS